VQSSLVTGATGFTGGRLARYLVRTGRTVRALVRNPDAPAARALAADGIELAKGDLTDRGTIATAMSGVSIVYNIAALYRDASLPRSAYRAVNADAVGAIVEEAARAGAARVVYCSTVGVHGDVERPPADEEAPLRPGDIYQETKLAGEAIAREASVKTGLPLVIARPTGIYGGGDRRLLKLFRGVARGRFVTLGRGEIFYHLTHIDDLVEGFRLCGEVERAAGRTYILAGPDVTTLNELVGVIAGEAGVKRPRLHLPVWPFWLAGALCEAICAPFGIEPPIYRRRVDFFTKSRAFDIGRARRELGYAPGIGVREGVRRTLKWYREHGWL
jgi:dihydroflavonol-4-reductase